MNPNSDKDFAAYINEKTIDELFSILDTIDKNNYFHRFQFVTERIQQIKKQKGLRDDYLPKTLISSDSNGVGLLFVALPTVFISVLLFWSMLSYGFSFEGFFMIVFFIALNSGLYFYDGTFKKVEIDSDYLYVTGRQNFAKIPRSKIVSVIDDFSMRNPRVYITFSEVTPFGYEVKFTPRSGGLYFSEFIPHKLVQMLLSEVNKKG